MAMPVAAAASVPFSATFKIHPLHDLGHLQRGRAQRREVGAVGERIAHAHGLERVVEVERRRRGELRHLQLRRCRCATRRRRRPAFSHRGRARTDRAKPGRHDGEGRESTALVGQLDGLIVASRCGLHGRGLGHERRGRRRAVSRRERPGCVARPSNGCAHAALKYTAFASTAMRGRVELIEQLGDPAVGLLRRPLVDRIRRARLGEVDPPHPGVEVARQRRHEAGLGGQAR